MGGIPFPNLVGEWLLLKIAVGFSVPWPGDDSLFRRTDAAVTENDLR